MGLKSIIRNYLRWDRREKRVSAEAIGGGAVGTYNNTVMTRIGRRHYSISKVHLMLLKANSFT